MKLAEHPEDGFARVLNPTIGASVIRIGCWGMLYHNHNKDPENSIGNYQCPYTIRAAVRDHTLGHGKCSVFCVFHNLGRDLSIWISPMFICIMLNLYLYNPHDPAIKMLRFLYTIDVGVLCCFFQGAGSGTRYLASVGCCWESTTAV